MLYANFYIDGVCSLQQELPEGCDIPELIKAIASMNCQYDDCTVVDDEGYEIDWTDL